MTFYSITPKPQIPPNFILSTMNAQSLYTNITQDEGTGICLSASEKYYQTQSSFIHFTHTVPLPNIHFHI